MSATATATTATAFAWLLLQVLLQLGVQAAQQRRGLQGCGQAHLQRPGVLRRAGSRGVPAVWRVSGPGDPEVGWAHTMSGLVHHKVIED